VSYQQRISTDMIRDQLRRILESPEFKGSERLSEFLRYVTEETLTGRSDQIKGYSIGVEVFGRTRDFDPQTDPVVRVVAGRLRRALQSYYSGTGADDPIRISIPKGRYVPDFDENVGFEESHEAIAGSNLHNDSDKPDPVAGHPISLELSSAIDSTSRRRLITSIAALFLVLVLLSVGWLYFRAYYPLGQPSRSFPTVIVLPFDNLDSDNRMDFLAAGLAEELSVRLERFQDLRVIAHHSSKKLESMGTHNPKAIKALGANFAVLGSVRTSETGIRISIRLVDPSTEVQLWAKTFLGDLSARNLFEIEDEITDGVVSQIAGEYGIISRSTAKASLGKADAELSVFEAICLHREYQKTLSPDLFKKALSALQSSAAVDPENATVWAKLAIMYGEAYHVSQIHIENALEKAAECANKAVKLDPLSQAAWDAMCTVRMLQGNRVGMIAGAKKLHGLNPHSSTFVGYAGWYMTLAGEYEQGLVWLKEGIKLNPYYPPPFHVAFFLDHYRRGEYRKALSEAEKLRMPDIYWDHMQRAASLGQLGKKKEALKEIDEMLRLKPEFSETPRSFIGMLVLDKNLVDGILAGLEKGGLPTTNR
jgi:adenylate cyclase